MNELEAANMEALKKELSGSIKKGIEFANQGSTARYQSKPGIASRKTVLVNIMPHAAYQAGVVNTQDRQLHEHHELAYVPQLVRYRKKGSGCV